MTTPTREQVVQWAHEAENGAMNTIDFWKRLATLARADLEADNKRIQAISDNYCALLMDANAELESLRKVIQLAADDIRRCDYTPARSKLLTAIAAAPKEK